MRYGTGGGGVEGEREDHQRGHSRGLRGRRAEGAAYAIESSP